MKQALSFFRVLRLSKKVLNNTNIPAFLKVTPLLNNLARVIFYGYIRLAHRNTYLLTHHNAVIFITLARYIKVKHPFRSTFPIIATVSRLVYAT